MEEMSPAVAVTVSVGNSVRENSGIATHVEITRFELVTDAVSLLSDSATPAESVCSGSRNEVKMVTISAPGNNDGGKADLMDIFPDNENNSIASDVMAQESKEDEILSIADVTNGIISEGLVVLDARSVISLPKSVEIENVESGKIVAEAFILEESSLDQVPTTKLLITAVRPNAEISDESNLKASAVLLQLPTEKILSKGGGRNVFELDCISLWGSVSICGKRQEMEDAVAAVPQCMKIPIKMLIGDRATDGISQSLTYLNSHFFGVYDGHGGSQVAKYCSERIHLALAEEIGTIKESLDNRNVGQIQQVLWEKAFTSCFAKVDDEIEGKACRGINGGNADACDTSSAPVAPETVGSTAVVALVCSSHIIVANCGDSRAVLCRGKEPMALSVDHKPDREDEYARIEASGGKVIQWNGHRVFGVLAMSRSIGDRYLKPWIIPEPEVMFIPRAREDECLILASDGLWDVMSNEEACEVARRRILLWHKKNGVTPLVNRGKGIDPAAQAAADYLSMLALQKGSRDNISVIVVDLKAQRKFKIKS